MDQVNNYANKLIKKIYDAHFACQTIRGPMYINTIGNVCIDVAIDQRPYIKYNTTHISILNGKNGRGERVLDTNFFEYVRDRLDEEGFTYDVVLKDSAATRFVVTVEMYD
jgi:hypothetical protein